MKAGVFREEYIAIIIKELLRGLEYLHQEGKLHRDIKGRGQEIIDILGYPCLLTRQQRSRKHSPQRRRVCQASRLWRLGPTFGNVVREKEYVCWNTLLDVPRSDQTIRIRSQSGHMESRDYRH